MVTEAGLTSSGAELAGDVVALGGAGAVASDQFAAR
jgi:hypothetical protein